MSHGLNGPSRPWRLSPTRRAEIFDVLLRSNSELIWTPNRGALILRTPQREDPSINGNSGQPKGSFKDQL